MSDLGSGLKVDELFEQAKPFLTEATIKALEIKSLRLTLFDNEMNVTGKCAYFGCKVKMSQVESGIKRVAEHLNRLSAEGSIISALAPFIKFDLSPETTGYFNEDGSPKELETVVLSYVHLPPKIYDREMPHFIKEGSHVNDIPGSDS